MSTRPIGNLRANYGPINTMSKNVAEGLNPEFIRYVVNQSLLHQGGFSTILKTIIATDDEVRYEMLDTIPISRYARTNASDPTVVSRLWERGLELIGFLAINNFAGYIFTESTTYVRDDDIIFGEINRITREYIQDIVAAGPEGRNFYNKAVSGELSSGSSVRANIVYEPYFDSKDEPKTEEEKQSPEWIEYQRLVAAETLAREQEKLQKQKKLATIG